MFPFQIPFRSAVGSLVPTKLVRRGTRAMFNSAISDAPVQFPLDLGATEPNGPTKAFRSANVSILAILLFFLTRFIVAFSMFFKITIIAMDW